MTCDYVPSKFYMRSHIHGFLQEPRHITGVLVFNPSTKIFPCLDSITLALSRSCMKEINGYAELASSARMIHLCVPLSRAANDVALFICLHGGQFNSASSVTWTI